MITITIKSEDNTLINSILYLLRGSKNAAIEISNDNVVSEAPLDFYRLPLLILTSYYEK